MFHRIVIEGHTYCNRDCDFCLVSYMDRKYMNDKMSKDTLEITLKEIKDNIHLFKQPLKFSLFRYNEPLAFPTLLMEQSRRIKEVFPNSFIYIHTNGDIKLTSSILERLEFVDEVYINDYDNKGMVSVLEDINTYVPNGELISITDLNGRQAIRINNNDKYFNYYVNSSQDIKITSRGSVVDGCDYNWINNRDERDYTCRMKGNILVVEQNGDIMACCEVSNRIDKHKELIVGNIKDGISNIEFDIDEFKLEACRYCHSSPEVCAL